MARPKKNDPAFSLDLFSKFTNIDPVSFIENNLSIGGSPYQLTGCGRDYLHEILRYVAFEAIKKDPNSKPVVVVKGRQVELTTTAASITIYFSCAMEDYTHITGIHAFPQIDQARRHSNKVFDERVRESKNGYLDSLREIGTGKSGNYSTTQKDFRRQNGDDYYLNTLYIDGTGPDGDRLRGIHSDYILFDEMQDIPQQAYDSLSESLSKAQFGAPGIGLKMMFGTPKDANSFFYKLWQHSDQRKYHLRCIHCGHYFPITLENYIKGHTVICLDQEGKGCRKTQEKQEAMVGGIWIPTNDGRDPLTGKESVGREVLYRGYHISQLLIPDITREAIDAKSKEKSPRAFANEVMGEFYSGSVEAISYEDVIRYTSENPDSTQWGLMPFVRGKPTWMGIDWGGRISGEDDAGKGGYTVITIISLESGGKFKLEYAHRLETDKVKEQINLINSLIPKFNVKLVAADLGYGHAQIQQLQGDWGDKVKAVYSGGHGKKTYSFNPDLNQIGIERSMVMEEVFDYIKQGAFCFPWKDFEAIEWLAAHISNVEVITSQVGGMTRKKFIKQSADKPIDGLMSLVYSYVAYVYSRTNGFANLQQVIQGSGSTQRSMPRSTLAKVRF